MDGYVTIGTDLDTKSFDAQIDYVKGQLKEIEYLLKRADAGEEIGKDTQKLEAQYEILTEKLRKLVVKKQELESTNLTNFENQMNNIGKSTSKVIKNISKWGLALLGIRSIYGFIRNAVNQVAQEDQTMQNQIQYINYAIGTALKPVLEFILNVVYKIVSGIGGIIKLLTGINIFSKATANNFAKANKSAGSLRKTLAGFDEMNVINESGGVGLLGDINSQLEGVKDLSAEADSMATKIKRWFLGGDTFKEGINNSITLLKKSFEPIVKWFEVNITNPIKDLWLEFIEFTKPLWQPVEQEFKKTVEKMKEDWNIFTDYLEPRVLQPARNKFNEFKNDLLKTYAPFFNTIIKWINDTFGIFGVKLNYIDIKSDNTGDNIKENIGGALDDTKKKADNLSKSKYNINIDNTKLKKSTSWLDDIITKLKNLTNKTWNIITSFTSNGINRGTVNSWLDPLRNTLGKIGIKLPYFAKGGIINMPGRGVPVGNAIAGERGQEGVIPLTDSQQMALLGEAIGKYISLKATIPVYVGNRMVARELKRINAEDDFAYNR